MAKQKGPKLKAHNGARGGGSSFLRPPAYEPGGILVANSEEFAKFEECMIDPPPPTPALLRGVELLHSLMKR